MKKSKKHRAIAPAALGGCGGLGQLWEALAELWEALGGSEQQLMTPDPGDPRDPRDSRMSSKFHILGVFYSTS